MNTFTAIYRQRYIILQTPSSLIKTISKDNDRSRRIHLLKSFSAFTETFSVLRRSSDSEYQNSLNVINTHNIGHFEY